MKAAQAIKRAKEVVDDLGYALELDLKKEW